MAGRIKGITVEIGGDVTKLDAALKKVNNEIKDTQSQLKDVERLLKLDPTNTTLLAQKQQLLTKAIEDTSKKLETLKEAEKQAQEQFQRGEISQEQYQGLQREIIATEQKLKSLQEQAAQSNVVLQQISAVGEKFQEVGGAVENAGEKLLPVTGAVVALGAAAVTTAAGFDAAMSQVAAVSGATGDDLEALREKAREMGATTKFSASEAAEALNYMAMAGWKTEDMLSGIDGVMNLAAASGSDLATVSDIVTDALTAFGLSAADSAHFADILAAASSNANTNVEMMGETFKYCAPVAGALGFSAEDTAQAIGLMANAGIKSSQAGTALRTIMTSLSSDIYLAGQNLGEMEIQTVNADGTMRSLSDILADCRAGFSQLTEAEAAAAAEGLVGKNAMSGFLALMNAGESDIVNLSEALASCDGSAAAMAATMQDNLAGQMTILKSQLEELAISFGEMLMPVIRSGVSAVQSFVDKLNSMDEGTRQAIITVLAIVAALGPLLIVIGKVISSVGTVMTVLPKLSGALTALTGPVGIVVAAIAGIVAILVVLWNNCEGFRDAVTAAWEVIKGAFQSFVDWLQGTFASVWETIVSAAQTAFEVFQDFLSAAWPIITELFQGFIDWFQGTFAPVWEAVVGAAQAIFEAFQDALGIAWDGITSIFNVFIEFFQGVFAAIWGDTLSDAQGTMETVGSAIQAVIEILSNVFSVFVAFLSGAFLTGFKGALQNALGFFTAVKDSIVQIIDGVLTAFQGVIDFIAGVFTGNWEQVWNGVKEIFRGIFEALIGIAKAPINGIIGILNGAIGAINTFIGGINKALSALSFFGTAAPQIPLLSSIAYLAKGGILEAGSAIVGEKGPELLSLVNGKARVTPLTNNGGESTAAPAAGIGSYNQTLNFYTQKMTPSEVARQSRNAARQVVAKVRG